MEATIPLPFSPEIAGGRGRGTFDGDVDEGLLMASCRVAQGMPSLLRLLALAGIVLLLGAYCCAADQSAQKPETAEDDAGDHLGDENDLLKGILDEHGDDDLAALEGDDDIQSFDDFDEDEDGHGVGMHDVGDDHDHTGSMSPEEEKIWREDEERFFKEADADKDGHLDKDEYTRAMMKEMSPHAGADPDEMEGGAAMPPPPSPALAGTGPLSTEGMTEDEKTHFEELGKQFVEEDLDKDGKISLEEWFNMMFHDMPQEPEFEDGHEDMWDHEHHHELSDEEKAEMLEDAKQEFNSTDANSDGKLTRDEILQFVKGPGLQDEQEEGEEPISAAELEEMAQELFKELDRDKDESISFDEFYKAHYEDPPHAMDGLETHPDDEHIDLPAVDGMGALDDTVADDR